MPKILTNFKYNSNSPNFERDQVKLKSSLGKATLDDYDFGHLVYCLEDKKIYIFQPLEETPGIYTKHNNITGYFLPFEKTLVTKDETIMHRLAVAFCSIPDPEGTPDNYPNGFEWNLKTDTIIAPQTQEGTQWYLTDADLKPYVWMSTGSFTSDKPSNPTWSKPVRITGADGVAGADGSTQEFIYLLSKKHTSIPTPQYKDEGDKSTFDAIPNYGAAVIPDYIFKDNDGETWRDHPIGVNNTYRYEYVSYRVSEQSESGDVQFGDWSEPTLWSSYGVWGKDGDGIEYVFINTTDDETPSKPEFIAGTTNEQKQENEVAQYLAKWEDYDWTDDPTNPSSNLPLVWVSIRRKYWKENSELESNGTSVWSDFTNPTIWARYSKDGVAGEAGVAGVAQFKSYVFKWSQSTPDKPADGSGSYDNPVPTGWSDGVPAQTDSETRLWMTTAWFENSDDWSATWTEPQVVSDTADFDAEFSSAENNPGNPTSNPDNWSNDADETTIWMATRKLSQGKWSNWTIAKIKGEKGQDGTSVKIKSSYKDLDAFKKDFWDATNNKWKAPTSEDNSYIVAGDLYVWDGDSWENVGQFRGEDGKDGQDGAAGKDGVNAYVHIKYANKGENAEGKYDFTTTIGETKVYLKLTGANGEDPGDYIGTFADSIVDDPSLSEDRFKKYTWKYWKGEDGYGYEYIYIRTKTATAPSTPTTSNNTNDYVPDTDYDPDWTDNATGVSVDYPFEWMCHRVKKDGVWGNWIGSSSDTTKAALWSHYGTGTTPDYKIYIYAKGDKPASAPKTGLTVAEVSALDGWYDYPDTANDQWWQCVGSVDGATNKVTEWSSILPLNGQDGTAKDGKHTEFRFAVNASATTAPTLVNNARNPEGWTTDSGEAAKEMGSGEYMWMTNAVIDADNNLTTRWVAPVRISGEQGPGITTIKEYYAKSNDGTTAPTEGWKETMVTTDATNKFLWNYEEVYISGSSAPFFKSPAQVIGMYSTNGKDGAAGKGIKSVTEYYCKYTSNTTYPKVGTTSWSTTPPTLDATNKYLWNYEVITYSDDTKSDPTTPCMIGTYSVDGAKGDKGDKGDTGDKGDKGDTGATGPQGPKGDDGKPGADGGIGPKGARLRMTEYNQYGPNGTANAKTKYLCGKNEGEEFYDVVFYTYKENNKEVTSYFLCNATHTGGSYLPTNTSSGYWTKADYWEFAATKLLLAEKISADDIDVDSLTASDLTVKKLHAVDGNSTVDVDVNGINQSYSDGAGHVMGLVSNKDYLRYRSYYTDTESGNTVTCEPLWIMKDGSGSLANGNISWTADGKIKADTYTPNYYSDASRSWVLPKIPEGYSKDFTIQYMYASRMVLTYDFMCDDGDDSDNVKSEIIYVWKDGTTAIKTNNGSWMQGTTNLGDGITPSQTDDNRAGIGFIHCYGYYYSRNGTVWTIWHLVEDSSIAIAIDDSSGSGGSSSTTGYTGSISIFDKFDTGHYFTFTNGILTNYDAEYNNQ